MNVETELNNDETEAGRTFARRAVIGAAAWSVPAITIASAAPAFAASGDTIALNSPPASFATGDWGYGPLSVTVKNAANANVAGALVSFTSNQTWVAPVSATATTNGSGVATMLLKFNSVPADGSTATLTASYNTSSNTGIVTVAWTVTYQPITVAARLALGNTPSSGGVYRQVRGYIRGNQTGTSTVDVTSPWTGDTNLIIGDTNTASTVATTLPVELSTSSGLRPTWGMASSPDQGVRVDITGDAIAYFSKPGLKDDGSAPYITILAV